MINIFVTGFENRIYSNGIQSFSSFYTFKGNNCIKNAPKSGTVRLILTLK